MAPEIALNADIRIEIFRSVAIREAEDEFQKPLLLPSFREDSKDRTVSKTLLADIVIGYDQAYRFSDIPINMNHVAAFNDVRGIRDSLSRITLIWENTAQYRHHFDSMGFMLKYRNNLESITHDMTRCRSSHGIFLVEMTKMLASASGRTAPPYKDDEARECKLRKVTLLINPNVTCQKFETEYLPGFRRVFGPGAVVDINSDLRKLVWKDAEVLQCVTTGSPSSRH